MDIVRGAFNMLWPFEEEGGVKPLISLEVLADAAEVVVVEQQQKIPSRKRGRLDSSSNNNNNNKLTATARRTLRKTEGSAATAAAINIPIDVANRGIARMLEINRVRFGVDEQHSVLYVFFQPMANNSRRKKEFCHEEEYPYLGPSVEELAEHVTSQGVGDVCTLASLYPTGFWNAVYLVGKDLDIIQEQLF